MSRAPLHALIWSTDSNLYELFTRGQLAQRFRPGDDDQWRTWLAAHIAFVFHGRAGRLNVHNEQRTRAKRYWYAYHVTSQRTKRYLGLTTNLTFARLEQVAGELSSAPDSAPRASHSPSPTLCAQMRAAVSDAACKAEQPLLLATKLAPPRLPTALVVRERLLLQLDVALDHRLTLLSAAAGWGKTTLLSAWTSRYPHQVAWLSLDELDNELTHFWVALIAALRRIVPRVPALGTVALVMLQSREPPPLSAILTALLNDLASLAEGAPLLLILDDYHMIDDEAIHDALTFFVEHLPDKLHLILASRVDPALPLSRWRVRGQLLEIRAADLRFSETEASSFFKGALGEVLTGEDVRLLERRCEGWIAGMQLAALALRQREDRSAFVQAFTGSHRYLLDYVQEEILERQPLPVQRFLLQSAVLSRMNAALCAALTDDPNSQQMLERLERHNLFVVPLDDERQWYRMHDLFREVLLTRLQTIEPELVPVLHLRTAHYFAAHDELRQAIAHALAGRDFVYAASLMERAAEGIWLSGEIQTLCRWVMALPDMVVRAHARLVLNAALYLLNSALPSGETQRASVRTQAEQMMARVEAVLRQQADGAVLCGAELALLQQRLRLLRGWYAVFEAPAQGDLEQMREIWHEMQELPIEDDLPWQMIPLHVQVVVSLREWLLRGERIASLVPPLLEAKQRIIQSGDRFATIKVLQWLALVYLNMGRLRQVQQECVAALELLQQLDSHSALGGYCRFLLALVLFDWNELDQARRVLRQMLHDAQIWQQGELEVVGYRLLAEVELSLGNLSEARQAVETAEQLAHQHSFAGYRSWMEALRVHVWLAEGNVAAANEWAAYVVSHPDEWNIPDQLPDRTVAALVWVNLVQQQYTQALETLERFSAYFEQPDNIATTIRFLVLHVLALHYSGKREQARAAAARVLALSAQEGYIRVYLQKGELMRRLLQSLLRPPRDQSESLPPASLAFVRKLLALFDQQARDERIADHTSHLPQGLAFDELLTPREQQVLRLLLAGASNQQIATQLVISLATVRKHVSNLLGKLGVENRIQVITRAREWHDLA
jgi:LuxR family maltose regulon positive regulatory protein